MQSLRKPLRLVLCILALAAVSQAEKSYLVIQVADIHNQPAVGVELAAEGSSESGTTDRFGRTRIKLDPQIKVNDWVAIQIVKSPAEKDLVLISPWDAHAQVPPFENETVNFLPVVVAGRGDRALLENGKALTAIAAQINKANSPKSKDPNPEKQRREALETIAKFFGLAPDDVDKAIRTWGERGTDPYEKGLAALYEKNYPLASKELSQSLEMREKELAKAQAATADASFFLGQAKYAEGKYRESVAAYRKAISLRPDDITVMSNLALSLYQAGDYAGAEPLLRRALAVNETALGSDHPEVGRALNNLAVLLYDKGDYTGAEGLYRRALAIAEKVPRPKDRNLGDALNNLGLLLKAKGDYAGAEQLFRRALAIDEKALGPTHPNVGADLNNLAQLIQAEGDYAGAETLFRRALAITEKALGPNHPDVANSLNSLALLLKDKGDYSGAEPLYRRALVIAEKALGPNHVAVDTYLNNLAKLLEAKGDYAGAEPLYRRALAIAEKALGPNHPTVGLNLNNLAAFLQAKGDYAGAEPLYRRALAITETALGPDHPTTSAIRENLAVFLNEKENAVQPK